MIPQATPTKPFSARWATRARAGASRPSRCARSMAVASATQSAAELERPAPAAPRSRPPDPGRARHGRARPARTPRPARSRPNRPAAPDGPGRARRPAALARAGAQTPIVARRGQHHGVAVDRAGQHPAIVVVGVLADQVHAPGSAGPELGRAAETAGELALQPGERCRQSGHSALTSRSGSRVASEATARRAVPSEVIGRETLCSAPARARDRLARAARRERRGQRPLPAPHRDGGGGPAGRVRRSSTSRPNVWCASASPFRRFGNDPFFDRFFQDFFEPQRAPYDPEPRLGRRDRCRPSRAHQRARGRTRQPHPRHPGRRARVRRDADRRRPEQRHRGAARRDPGEAALDPARELARPDGGRALDRDRQSLRAGEHRDHRRGLRARSLDPLRVARLPRLHPDRCFDQSRQLGRRRC